MNPSDCPSANFAGWKDFAFNKFFYVSMTATGRPIKSSYVTLFIACDDDILFHKGRLAMSFMSSTKIPHKLNR